jgi:DNA polymerase elongation subunit (family B)
MKEFNVIDWQSLDLKISGEKHFIIRAFGRTMPDNKNKDNDEVISLEIRGFKPYFYFEIQEKLENGDWVNRYFEIPDIEDILRTLKCKINGREDCYLNDDEKDDEKIIQEKENILKNDVFTEIINERIEIVNRKKFDYFRNNQEDQFYMVRFETKRAFNLYKKLLKKVTKNEDFEYENKNYRFIQYESNIEPIIRFFHEQKINPSGWIKCEDYCAILKGKNSMVQENINAYFCNSYRDVLPVENNMIAPFKIASFDIECTSHDGNFPQAKRAEDKIIQIGITTHRQGEMNPYEECIITLKPCQRLKDVKRFKVCDDEKDLLLTFAEYIRDELDPDIITGYNIWGFDWMYMYERSILLKIEDDFCKMSRISYETCRYVEKSLSSSALGDNLLKYIEMTGRVQIDLFKLIQKDYNLTSYKLTAVSANFLQGNVELVVDNSLSEEDRIYCEYHKIKSKSIDGIYVDNQISLIDQYENKVRNGYKFTVTELDKKNNIITVRENLRPALNQHEGELEQEMKDLNLDFDKNTIKYRWCENKIDLPPQNIFDNFKKNTPESMREIAIYCIKDCVLCNSLIIKLDVVTKNMGMSNVCCVPFSYLFLRGQGVKVFSVISKQCQEDNFVIPVITKEDFTGDSSYEGAIVLQPKTGIYFKPVAVMDYGSLYPSSMISENISHDSLMKITYHHVKKDDEGNIVVIHKDNNGDDVYEFEVEPYDEKGPEGIDIDKYIKDPDRNNPIEYNNFDKNKNVIGKTVCYYYQPPNNEKSVLPRVLQRLLQARKETRKRQKQYSKDDFMWSVLEGLQLAYKVTCNSLYGQVGASTSQVCKTELAASTTATGRELLELARDMIVDNYKGSECIYGDTDSVFIQFDTYDLSEAIRLGKEAGQKVTDKLIADGRQPHDLEYEKTFYPFVLFSKKRYVGNKYEEDVNKFSQNSMGIVLKRRDNARILKDIYQGVINTILNEKGDKEVIMQKAVDFYKNAVNRLMIGEVSFNKLEISKTVKGNYKNPTSIAHKVLADRMRDRDPGNAPAINDRVPYVYIDVKTLCCNNCNKKDIELSKCMKCLKLYGQCKLSNKLKMCKEEDYINNCFYNHECNIICRFCHIKLPQDHKCCKNCEGYFCEKCEHKCINKISPRLLQGDRIEHPDYLLKNEEIKPDYKYYFEHQIERPVQQIFDLTNKKEEIEEFCKEITMGEEYVKKQKEKNEYENTFSFSKRKY